MHSKGILRGYEPFFSPSFSFRKNIHFYSSYFRERETIVYSKGEACNDMARLISNGTHDTQTHQLSTTTANDIKRKVISTSPTSASSSSSSSTHPLHTGTAAATTMGPPKHYYHYRPYQQQQQYPYPQIPEQEEDGYHHYPQQQYPQESLVYYPQEGPPSCDICKCSQCDPNYYTMPLRLMTDGKIDYVCRDCQFSSMKYSEVEEHEKLKGHRRWYNYPQ